MKSAQRWRVFLVYLMTEEIQKIQIGGELRLFGTILNIEYVGYVIVR